MSNDKSAKKIPTSISGLQNLFNLKRRRIENHHQCAHHIASVSVQFQLKSMLKGSRKKQL